MRNLKRALSLALASVMLLGMMVVGTSAASYPDVDEKDNVEAIEVLNAVKVMIGRQGNFEPDEAVNRHEMAVIMAKLVLGNETADNYVGTHPFTDVVSWADKYVAACYENGLVAGTSATTFSGSKNLTAVEAAAMMLRALGYKDLSKGATDWRAPVTAMANQIRLFSGVASNPSEQLDRNQVAQLALNTLKSPVVDLKDGTFDITSGDGQVVITGGSREYIVRSSYESYARAINRTESAGTSASSVSGYTIELGEHLYNGKLRLEDETDVFGRPARQWVYDGDEIGTYAKDELLRREYTAKVTGRNLYDLLGTTILNDKDWDVIVTIDGDDTENPALFTKSDLTRTNTDAVGGTGKGVLTEVYVDSNSKDVYITIINTFLAIADEDYDSKNGEVDLTVYALKNDGTTKNPEYIKDKTVNGLSVTVEDEDIDVSGVKEDDMFLVTVADGKVQSMAAPEVLSDREISSFKVNSDVVSDGNKYEYANTAKYDVEVLEDYSQTNMKDTTYNIILDKYGYLIGLEANSDPDQYVFVTGMDGKYSPITSRNADANVIHMDGTMETVTVNVKKSAPIVDDGGTPKSEEGGDWTDGNGTPRDVSQINTWCTYSVNSAGVYTLKEVGPTFPAKGTKVAQAMQDAGDGTGEVEIDKKNVTLADAAGTGKVYGNDDTVYINVSLAALKTTSVDDEGWFQVIDDVDSVTTGAKNASLKVAGLENGTSGTNSLDGSTKAKATYPTNEIYTLYKNNGYIIGAVVVGEDTGLSKTYAYIHSDDVKRETYDKAKDEWTWVREAIVDGKIVDLREVGGGTDLSELEDMDQNNWYEVKTDADGNVTDATLIAATDTSGGAPTNPPHSSTTKGAALAKDYVFCVDYTNHIADPAGADYPKFIGSVDMVRGANLDNDQVILFQKGFTAPEADDDDTIEYKNGTLYVNTDDIKGFDVSPTVKTVLCLSDGEGGAFDDVIDTYEGYKGLENAIKNLDSNFTGDLSVVFEKGSAVVVIFNDTTLADEEEEPAGDATIVGNANINTANPDDVTLEVYVYGGTSVGNSAVKKYLEETYGGTATQKNGRWSFGTTDNSYEGVTVSQTQVWKVTMASTWQDAASNGTDKALITAAAVDNATIKVGSTVYVKATGTVDLKVTVGTLTTNTTLTIQVANNSATLVASTKDLDKDTDGDHDATVSVTTGALSNITKDIELNVKVTDT